MISKQYMNLISNIYDLPLQPDKWADVLDEFAPTMGAAGATIIAFDPIYSEHQLSMTTSNYEPAFLVEYGQRFGALDQEAYNSLIMNPRRGFISDMEILEFDNIDQVINHPPNKWMNEKAGINHRAVSSLNLDRVWTDMLAVQHFNDHGPITDAEKEIGTFFLDHFAKSIELGRSFGVLKSRFDGVLGVLDRFHMGIFVLSPNGSVVVKNAEADRILDAGDGLSLSRDGRLQPSGDSERGEIKDIISKAISTAQANGDRAEQLMVLPRASGSDSYLVEVSPIRDHGEIESDFKGCLVFVIDPNKTDVVSTEGMQALYQLTGAESEICKLIAEGMETDHMAEAKNITNETVRSHIKKILQKTGVNNRSQLVRLALSVNLPIDQAAKEE